MILAKQLVSTVSRSLLAFGAGVFLVGCQDGPMHVGQLQTELALTEAGWQARVTTPAAQLDELQFGEVMSPRDQVYGSAFQSASEGVSSSPMRLKAALPEKFDWRDVDGRSYVAPVRDQGKCGACVAFAALTTLESSLNVARKTPFSPWNFSRQHMFACGGGQCSSGWYLSQAVDYLRTTGVPDSSCLRYTSGEQGQDVPCGYGCGDAVMRSLRIASYQQPTKGFVNVERIKQALLKGPVLSSIILYEDFLFYDKGVYRHTTGRQRGSHAVTLIGWDDALKAWIGRNSMGTDWGMNGDFYIAWDDTSTLPGRYTYQFELPDDQSYVAIEDLGGGRDWHGEVPVVITSGVPGASAVELMIVHEAGELVNAPPVLSAAVTSSPEQSPVAPWKGRGFIDSTRLSDGEYFVFAKVEGVDSVGYSHPHKIKIVNKRITR